MEKSRVHVPVGLKVFTSENCPYWLWGPLDMEGSFPKDKEVTHKVM
jgi:hypothetical protein